MVRSPDPFFRNQKEKRKKAVWLRETITEKGISSRGASLRTSLPTVASSPKVMIIARP